MTISRVLIAISLLWQCQTAIAGNSLTDPPAAARDALAKHDYCKALPLVQMLASEGRPEFEYQYGCMLLKGLAMKKDTKQALAVLSKAAAASYLPAQMLLAEMYEAGEGTAVNEQKAAELWRSGAAEGDPRAVQHLSAYYMHLGESKNNSKIFNQGFDLLKTAAKHGYGSAMVDVINIYWHGQPPFVPKDPKTTIQWCQLGIKQKNGCAADTLGHMYKNGEGGLPCDPAKGFLVWTQFDDFPEMQVWRARISKNPSKSDVAAAWKWWEERLTARYKPTADANKELWDILHQK